MSHETRQSLENDGHRTILWRDAETVRLQARSGRTVISAWMDLAVAGMNSLRPGTVLDGEADLQRRAGRLRGADSRFDARLTSHRSVMHGAPLGLVRGDDPRQWSEFCAQFRLVRIAIRVCP